MHYRVPGFARRSIDVAFVGPRLAVFLDGCFWHGCPQHATWPARNADFWRQKIEANRKRDCETDALLAAAGWRVIRIWEHEDTDAAASRIRDLVKERR